METKTTIPPALDAEMLATLRSGQTPLKIIDVRTPAEFETVHIPGSYNVPLDLLPEHRDELRDRLRSPAVLVCQSGNRARQAEQILRNAALDNVHVLDGGIGAWMAAGKPVNRGKTRWGLERQVRGVAGSLVLLSVLAGMRWKPVAFVSAFVGAGLAYSAATDTCGMAMLLSKLPYNQGATCDVREVVMRLANEQV